eukprot:CAMPEP_0175612806 /NCGR_PEP_ID=MMETSP0096-20121207/64015_1 /TAXON_ID=311494 /ORGANISM="Alexandrium monilatum, Strain CCMP3105" /LENGTH=83 /DNA_ID=CAMNT_0016917867 /DNA_START=8 /DNA_END=256 /DNA_ORIENTATION=-
MTILQKMHPSAGSDALHSAPSRSPSSRASFAILSKSRSSRPASCGPEGSSMLKPAVPFSSTSFSPSTSSHVSRSESLHAAADG